MPRFVLLAALSLVGVPPVAFTPQVDGINFAPWYVVVSALVLLLFFYNAAQPSEEIPNLHRMERINRYVRAVVLGVSALMVLLCLLIPVVSFAAAGYEPVGCFGGAVPGAGFPDFCAPYPVQAVGGDF